jgi:hypothetical protein
MCVDFYVWAFSLRGFVTSAFRHSVFRVGLRDPGKIPARFSGKIAGRPPWDNSTSSQRKHETFNENDTMWENATISALLSAGRLCTNKEGGGG